MTTRLGDPVPWVCLRWKVRLAAGEHRVELTDSEFYLVCAATELDRLHSLEELADRVRAYRRLSRGARWSILVAQAPGVAFEDAPGEMTVEQVFHRLGVEKVEWRHVEPRSVLAQVGRAALRNLREQDNG